MKLTVAVPVFNQLADTKAVWGCHIANIANKKDVELLVIDNGSTDGYGDWLNKFVFPFFPDHRLIRNEDNIGLLPTMNQIWKEASGDVIAVLHNDLFVYEEGWDERVLAEFEADEKLGLAGFFGALGIGQDGGRMGCYCNFVEAGVHGTRSDQTFEVLAFDGISLICRKAMLDDIDGFDTGLNFHHFYDKMISLDSHFAGWTNKYIGVLCHHMNGLTANRPDYQKWADKAAGTENNTGDLAIYKESEAYFLNKYKNKLPATL